MLMLFVLQLVSGSDVIITDPSFVLLFVMPFTMDEIPLRFVTTLTTF